MSRSQLTSLLFAILFFGAAIGYDTYTSRNNNLQQYQEQIQAYLHQQEARVANFVNDRDFIHRICGAHEVMVERDPDFKKLKSLTNEKFTIYITSGDSVLFWNNNSALLPADALSFDSPDLTTRFIEHTNGYYQLSSQTSIDEELGQYTVHSMIPIKYNYKLVSNYIKDEFLASNQIPTEVRLVSDFTSFPIYNSKGDLLFYLDAADDLIDTSVQQHLIWLYLFGFLALGYLIHLTTLKIIKVRKPWMGAAFLITSIFTLRMLSIAFDWTERFRNLPLFAQDFESVWTSSLSDMLINIVLLLWIMIFFQQFYPVTNYKPLSKPVRFGITTVYYLTIVLSIFFLTTVFKTVVYNSALTFDFNNVFNLNRYSMITIIGIILLITALFIFSHRSVTVIAKLGISRSERMVAVIAALLLAQPAFLFSEFLIPGFIISILAFLFIMLFDVFVDYNKITIPWIMIWLTLLSAFPSTLLFTYNSYKDITIRRSYAIQLAEEEDTNAEASFHRLAQHLREDRNFVDKIILPPPYQADLKEITGYFDQYFTSDNYLFYNYKYSVNAFDQDKGPIITGQEESYKSYLKKITKATPTSQKGLYLWQSTDDRDWSYLLEVPIQKSRLDSQSVDLIFEFQRGRREQSKVYTELLVDRPYKDLKHLNKYNFAIYKNNKQYDSEGSIYGSTLTVPNLPGPGETKELVNGDRSEVIHRGADGKTVVIVGRDKETYIKGISLFSYILTLLVMVLFLSLAVRTVSDLIAKKVTLAELRHISLKSKIQGAVVLLTLFSFLFIGITTVWFFKNSSEEYHENRLERKASSILTDAQREIEMLGINNIQDQQKLKSILKPVSETHRIDINLYDLNGELIGSSEEDLYKKGVISRRMGAVAYQALTYQGLYNYNQEGEHIGNLNYKVAYVSLVDANKKPVAYMGLPYYSKQSKLRNDVTLFMSTLLNIYVFLLFIAGGIAMFTANSITKPIVAISEKIKRTELGKRNEPLVWKSKDELGVLIKEYNKMIDQLDNSADKIAQSEREGAWREMAKQVAHEIKNPLTPMKLSIQYLSHAYQSKPENIEPLLKRVSATLIEQIDNLAQIASEFSNFAKMPRAENQRTVLNGLVQMVYDLFRSEDVNLQLNMAEEQFHVYADKNHLTRVFNNLIKNAIQAIPEDRDGVVTVAIYRQEDRAIVCVSDNGTGISDDKREKVFVPNFTTKNSGTGLGLAISKNIIESVSGRIWFTTVVGEGTKFYVELPIEEVQEPELV